MKRGLPFSIPLAALLAGCGLLLGTTDDPYVDPTLSIPPGPDGGEAATPSETGTDAGNDAEIDVNVEDAPEDAEEEPDV